MDNIRRRNHWVPSAYLSAFTHDGTKDGLLTIYDREQPQKALRLPPHAIAKEKDLYVVERDGKLDDSIERMLADHVETPFLTVRSKLAHGPEVGIHRSLLDHEHDALCLFLAFQNLRTPRARETFNLLGRFQATMVARAVALNPERSRTVYQHETGNNLPEGILLDMLALLDSGALRVEVNKEAWLQTILGQAVEVANIVKELPWMVIDAPSDVIFPTCDVPVVMVRRENKPGKYTHGGGWKEPRTEITFPVSPKSVLVLGATLDSGLDIGSKEWCLEVRRRTIESAER